MFCLLNEPQFYGWGKVGKDSAIYDLLVGQDQAILGDALQYSKNIEDKPIAEFWMGGHPKSESQVILDINNTDKTVGINEFLKSMNLKP